MAAGLLSSAQLVGSVVVTASPAMNSKMGQY